MPGTRSVVLFIILLCAFSLAFSIRELSRPPDSEGRGLDSFGTMAQGHRGIFEVLETLKIPVERGLVPPPSVLNRLVCLVFWGSDERLVNIEPGHIARVARWLEAGGAVVLAPPRDKYFPAILERESEQPFIGQTNLWRQLGLPELSFRRIDEAGADVMDQKPYGVDEDLKWDDVLARHKFRPEASHAWPVSADGTLTGLGEVVHQVAGPVTGIRVLDDIASGMASGRVYFQDSRGIKHAVAAQFETGKGRAVVVSDPRLLDNHLLAKGDNAILAAHLFHGFAKEGRTIVFDEFYHGLTIRGNPLWLLGRQPYGLLAALAILVTLLWAWRESVHLGPPCPERKVIRRTVVEYVDAMGHLFHRGGWRRHVLNEFREGMLWMIRGNLGLPPGREDAETLARVLARREPDRANKLREADGDIAAILKGQVGVGNRVGLGTSEQGLVEAARKMSECL